MLWTSVSGSDDTRLSWLCSTDVSIGTEPSVCVDGATLVACAPSVSAVAAAGCGTSEFANDVDGSFVKDDE